MQKFVFFNAIDRQVQVSIEHVVVGSASNAAELLAILQQHNVTQSDNLFFSSDVDFASEEGFDTDSCAHDIIDAAVEQL